MAQRNAAVVNATSHTATARDKGQGRRRKAGGREKERRRKGKGEEEESMSRAGGMKEESGSKVGGQTRDNVVADVLLVCAR